MKFLIVKFFGTTKEKKAFDFKKISSVLIKPIGFAVGDAVAHIAHLDQIKQAIPNVKIAVLVTERNKQLFSHAKDVDFIFEDKVSTYFLQRAKWDLYLDFQPTFTTRSIILDNILKPKFIINFGKQAKKNYTLDTVKNYDFATHIPDNAHITNYLNYSVFGNYLPREQINYNLNLSNEKYSEIISAWHPGKLIKILLNPQGSMREIPPAELSVFLNSIDPKYIDQISFLLTNTKDSATYLDKLDHNIDIKLAPKTDILAYCTLVNSSDIVIAVDGGGVHMACAFGKKLLSFYANHPHNIARWHPKPKKGVETFMVIANNYTNDNHNTSKFSVVESVTWLNSQIEKLLKK